MTNFRTLWLIECGLRIVVHRALLIAVLEQKEAIYRPVVPLATWAADLVATHAV